MIPKKQRSFLAVLISILTLTAGGASVSQAEEVILRRNNFNFSFGAFQLSGSGKTVSSVGMFQLQYRRDINPNWSVEGSYVNGVALSGFSSFFWGFDLGVVRAFWLGSPTIEKSDVMIINEHRKFGILGGVGFSQRAVPLTTGTLSYSGPYICVHPQYYLTEALEAHARLQYGMLVNGRSNLSQISIVFGMGLLF